MPVHYSLPGVELYVMSPGLPSHYNNRIITGSEQSFIIDNFGETVNQSVATNQTSIALQVKKWCANTKMICHHEFQPGMFTRVLFDEKQKEKIRGIGMIELKPQQFYSLIGSNFTSSMFQEGTGEYSNVSFWWSVDFIKDIIEEYPVLQKETKAIINDFPKKIITPPLSLTNDMKLVIGELLNFDYTLPGVNKFQHEKMKKLARLIIKESMELPSARTGSTEKNWDRLQKALHLIRTNPLRNLTAEQLSAKVLLSERILRDGIKAITGMPLAEFSRTMMYIESGRQIFLDNERVKTVSNSAGIASRSAYGEGFEIIFWCTPGELRAKNKKLRSDVNYVMSIEEKYKYGSIIARYMSERETNEDITELNKWLDMNDHHIQLFNQLLDDTKTAWTRQWFDAAGIKHNKIRWTKDGGWYRYDLGRDEQIDFYKYAVLYGLGLIAYYLIFIR